MCFYDIKLDDKYKQNFIPGSVIILYNKGKFDICEVSLYLSFVFFHLGDVPHVDMLDNEIPPTTFTHSDTS